MWERLTRWKTGSATKVLSQDVRGISSQPSGLVCCISAWGLKGKDKGEERKSRRGVRREGEKKAGRADTRTGVDGSCCGQSHVRSCRAAHVEDRARPPAPAQGGRRSWGSGSGATVAEWAEWRQWEKKSEETAGGEKRGAQKWRGDLRGGLQSASAAEQLRQQQNPHSWATGRPQVIWAGRVAFWFEIHFQLTEFWYKKWVRNLLFF